MKKRTQLYISVLSTIILLSACKKSLDLKPYQQIDQSQAITTSADVQITLVGAYNRAAQADLYGGGVFLYSDLLADQQAITWQGTYQGLTQLYDQSIPVTNTFVNALWAEAYQTINQSNNVLANISKVVAADQNRTTGEAKFLRGMTYFDLARLFGRAWNDGDPNTNLAVPIVLTPTTTITAASNVSRSTVAQVYQQAIADLTDAESKLPAKNSFYATSYAASAILARLYLQKGDLANAAAEANKVISSNAFQLNAAYTDEFPYPGQVHVDNTVEDIFAIQVTTQSGTNYLNTFYASADNSGRGDIIIKNAFINSFEAGDTRASVYNEDSDGILRNDKFDNIYGNIHVVRLAEMYLIRAEANLRAGTSVGAAPKTDVNIIRERAGLGDLATVTLNNILNERVHELAFEGGFFLHDGKRLQGPYVPEFPTLYPNSKITTAPSLNAGNIGGLIWNSPKLVFPIPFQDITANPNLKQNPGY